MADKNYVASSIKKVTTQYGDLFNYYNASNY